MGNEYRPAALVFTIISILCMIVMTGCQSVVIQEEKPIIAAEAFPAPTLLLPKTDEAAGIKLTDDPISEYTPEDLWEYIDGEAEEYNLYKFARAAVARYTVGSSDYEAAIYEFAAPRYAYGLYSSFKSGGSDTVPAGVGSDAFVASRVLNVWQGRYYLHIEALAEEVTPEVQADLVKLGGAIAAKLPEKVPASSFLARLPRDMKVQGTEQFRVNAHVGGLTIREGTFALYSRGMEKAEVMVTEYASPTEAQQAYYAYFKELQDAREIRYNKYEGSSSTLKQIENGKFVAVGCTGRFVFGVFDATSREVAEELIKATLRDLE